MCWYNSLIKSSFWKPKITLRVQNAHSHRDLNFFGTYFVVHFIPSIKKIFEFKSANLFGLITISRKILKHIGPILIYQLLFIFDIIYLPQILIDYTQSAYNYDITILSSLECKICIFFNYSLDSISPWLLVYISIEKFVAINYPREKFLIRKKSIRA